MKSGIYIIENTANGKVYVGSSKKVNIRLGQHKLALRKNKHHSAHLQASFNKHGADKFVFRRVITCSERDMIMYEQRAIDAYKATDANHGFNMAKYAHAPATARPTKDLLDLIKRKRRDSAKKHLVNGEMLCVVEAAEKYNLRVKVLEGRIADGMSMQEAVEKPQRAARNIRYPHNGKMLTIDEIANEIGIPRATARARLFKGWSVDRIILTPVEVQVKPISYNGKTQSMAKWAKELSIPQQTMVNRLGKLGWSVERAFSTPKQTKGVTIA